MFCGAGIVLGAAGVIEIGTKDGAGILGYQSEVLEGRHGACAATVA